VGGSWIYTHSYAAVVASCPVVSSICLVANPDGGTIPSSRVLNLSATWEGIAGLPVDVSAFATNVTNEVYLVSLNDNTARSFRSGLLGEPRMYGVRVKVRFGQ
jgi:outer membrane receptor protein involved in Fe transport